jgi:cell division protein FtsQ
LRVNWNYIKMFLLLVLVVTLFAFSSSKNSSRKITEFKIQFQGDNNLFITEETVSKLLIQNQQGVKKMPKETLDLNQLESALNSNPMVKSAEVYMTLNGEVNADIVQKKPIARVSTNASYYIDDQGTFMPLSDNHSARVPLVTGHIDKNNLNNVFTMANKIQNDEFLKKNVVEINQDINKTIYLRLRQCSFKAEMGDINNLDKKINNLKAFYKKSLKEKTLNNYSNVNLQFDNQVVCTKL